MKLLESSIEDLQKSIELGFPNTTKRQHIVNTVSMSGVQLIPWIGTRLLYAKGTVSSNGNTYNPIIVFQRVEFDNESFDDNITFTASDGEEYHIRPIHKELTQIRVRCNCLDYYYRFAHYNHADKSHQPPKAKPYRRVTTTYPPANPNKVPGVCKHILRLANYLEQTDIID